MSSFSIIVAMVFVVSPELLLSLHSNLSSTLIAYYQFDGNLLDSSGNGHDGSINNDGTEYYSTDNAINTQSFYFNGNTRIEIDSLKNYVWDENGYFSISLWLKKNNEIRNHMSLINNGYYYCSSFEIRLDRDNGVQAAVFSVDHEADIQGGRPAYGHSFKIDEALQKNDWEHIALTYNANKSPDEQLTLYINSILIGTSHITDGGSGIVIHDHPLYIAHYGDDCTSEDEFFSGYIDELILFEYELVEDDVLQIYNDGISTLSHNNNEMFTTTMLYPESTQNTISTTSTDTVTVESTGSGIIDNNNNNNTKKGEIIGIIFMILALIGVSMYFYWMHKKKKNHVAIPAHHVPDETVEMIEGTTTTKGTYGRTASVSITSDKTFFA